MSERPARPLLAGLAAVVTLAGCTTTSPGPQLSVPAFPEQPQPTQHTSSATPVPGAPVSPPILAEWGTISGIMIENIEYDYVSSTGYRSTDSTILYFQAGDEPGVLYGPSTAFTCIADQAWSNVAVSYKVSHDVTERFSCDAHSNSVGTENANYEVTSHAEADGNTLKLSGEIVGRIPRLLTDGAYWVPTSVTHRENFVLTIHGDRCEVTRLESERVEPKQLVLLQYGPREPETITWRHRTTPATTCKVIRF